MATALACLGPRPYPLVLQHPWRPEGYVFVGNGDTPTRVQVLHVATRKTVVTAYLELPDMVHCIAVHSAQQGWGSDDTLVACAGATPVVAVLKSEGGSVLAVGGGEEHPQLLTTSLQWSPDGSNTLAAALSMEGAEPSKAPRSLLRVYDVTLGGFGGNSMTVKRDFQCHGAFSVAWCSDASLLVSTMGGLLVKDLRAQDSLPSTPGRVDGCSSVQGLTRHPTKPNYFVGVRLNGDSSSVHLWDIRKVDKGAVSSVHCAYQVSSLSWSKTGSHFVTTALDALGTLEVWDALALIKSTTTSPDPGYESDLDCRGGETSDTSSHRSTKASWRSGGDGSDRRLMRRGTSRKTSSHSEEWKLGRPVACASFRNTTEHHHGYQFVLAYDDATVSEFTAIRHTRVGFAPFGCVLFDSDGPSIASPDHDELYDADVSYAMHLREQEGYGMCRLGNYAVASFFKDIPLQRFSYWLWLIRRASENSPVEAGQRSFAFPGILEMLSMPDLHGPAKLLVETVEERKERRERARLVSEGARVRPADIAARQPSTASLEAGTGSSRGHHAVLESQFKVHLAEGKHATARQLLQALCGWQETDLPSGVVMPCVKCTTPTDHYEREVSLRILKLRLCEAEDLLRKPWEGVDGTFYGILAFAFSNLTLDSSKAWRDMVPSLDGLSPLLLASLQFLSSWNSVRVDQGTPWDRYSFFLDSTDIDVLDRIAFATRYLNDSALHKYFERLVEEEDGRDEPLLPVMLHGLSRLTHLTSFLDRTGDVQVTACTAAAFMHQGNQEMVQRWTKAYRDFLLQGGSDFARCRADIHFAMTKRLDATTQVASATPASIIPSTLRRGLRAQRHLPNMMMKRELMRHQKPPEEESKRVTLQVLCRECLSVLLCPLSDRLADARQGRQHSQPNLCPHCSCPLPKCSVCLQILGQTPEGTVNLHVAWCISCRHGGHVEHLVDWFSEHEECPVAECNCTCSSKDIL